MSYRHAFLFFMLFSLVAGCAGTKKESPQAAQPPEPAPPPAVLEAEARQRNYRVRTGSLYQQGQGSLFTANKASRIGDILTVAIYERASAEKEAETETGRSSSTGLEIPKFFGYAAALAAKNPNLDPSGLVSAKTENSFEGSGSTSREERLSATLTTRVVGEDANGNLRIEGTKTVRVNNEDQIIRLSGMVRPADIAPNNIVDSQYILDARIEYTGDGVISEKQRPGWLARLIDVTWPF
jgi:flagellar L-ring protein precursor FlgH